MPHFFNFSEFYSTNHIFLLHIADRYRYFRQKLSNSCCFLFFLSTFILSINLALPAQSNPVYEIDYSPNGKRLLSAHYDGTVGIWDIRSGKREATFYRHPNPVIRAQYTPDGKYIVSASFAASNSSSYSPPKVELRLWDIKEDSLFHKVEMFCNRVYPLSISPDGKVVTTGSFAQMGFKPAGRSSQRRHRGFLFWELDKDIGEAISGYQQSYITAWDPSGKYFVTGNYGGSLTLWEANTWKVLHDFIGHKNKLKAVAFSPDGKYLVSAAESGTSDRSRSPSQNNESQHPGTLRLWDVAAGKEIHRFGDFTSAVFTISFSPDGKYLVSGVAGNRIILWETISGKVIRQYSGHGRRVQSVDFAPNGKQFASSGSDARMIVWDLKSAKPVKVIPYSMDEKKTLAKIKKRQKKPPAKAKVKPKKKELPNISVEQGGLWFVSTATGEVERILPGNYPAACSPDGKWLVSTPMEGAKNELIIWKMKNGKISRRLKMNRERITQVAVSPGANWIAAASNDGGIEVWAAKKKEPLHRINAHTGYIDGLRFSPDSRFIISKTSITDVKRWAIDTVEAIETIDEDYVFWDPIVSGEDGEVQGGASTYSPDSQYVAVHSARNATAVLYDAKTERRLAAFKRIRDDWIGKIAFSPDSRRLIIESGMHATFSGWSSGSAAAYLSIYDIETRYLIDRLEGHWSVVFSPNGKFLVFRQYTIAASRQRPQSLILGKMHDEITSPDWAGHRGNLKLIKNVEKSVNTISDVLFTPDNQYLILARRPVVKK